MVHRFRLSGAVLHAENRYTLLYKCYTALIFVVLSDVIHPYVCSTLYGSYSNLNLVWLSSPGSSVAWLLGGVRHVIRPSEPPANSRMASLSEGYRPALVCYWSDAFVISVPVDLLHWSLIYDSSVSIYQMYYVLASMALKHRSLTLSCIVLCTVLPVL